MRIEPQAWLQVPSQSGAAGSLISLEGGSLIASPHRGIELGLTLARRFNLHFFQQSETSIFTGVDSS